jgi:hypothetical protein
MRPPPTLRTPLDRTKHIGLQATEGAGCRENSQEPVLVLEVEGR